MEGVDISEGDAGFAMLLTLLAGLATTIGAAIAFCVNTDDNRVFAICLGLAAGVMAYVSFSEILDMTNQSFQDADLTERSAFTFGTLTVFGGIVLAMLVEWIGTKIFHRHVGEVDIVITDAPEPEAQDGATDKPLSTSERLNMLQMAAFSGIAVALHNFPEGIATFISTMADPSFGPAMAFAIAMHNIPEGLAVAAPIKKATGSKCKAFFWAFVSGLSEPLGGLLGWLVLKDVLGPATYGIFYGLTAGIMIHISFKKLLPTALKYDPGNRYTSYSFFAGMAVMAVSLIAFSSIHPGYHLAQRNGHGYPDASHDRPYAVPGKAAEETDDSALMQPEVEERAAPGGSKPEKLDRAERTGKVWLKPEEALEAVQRLVGGRDRSKDPRAAPLGDCHLLGFWGSSGEEIRIPMRWDGMQYYCSLDIPAGEDAMLQVSAPAGRIYPSVEGANPSIRHELLGPHAVHGDQSWFLDSSRLSRKAQIFVACPRGCAVALGWRIDGEEIAKVKFPVEAQELQYYARVHEIPGLPDLLDFGIAQTYTGGRLSNKGFYMAMSRTEPCLDTLLRGHLHIHDSWLSCGRILGRLSWPVAADLGVRLLRTLQAIHRKGILHCDMKPGNILLRRGEPWVQLIDFGRAGNVGQTRFDAGHGGMRDYMSVKSGMEGGQRSTADDVESLGWLLFRCLHGGFPWSAKSPDGRSWALQIVYVSEMFKGPCVEGEGVGG
ncbi:zupT [Symbiodinium sp. CCMP2592]|nr:zupT [Symbiodinium sp. CCMP2592]